MGSHVLVIEDCEEMTRAEDKYDLQLVNTKTDKPIQQQPWSVIILNA